MDEEYETYTVCEEYGHDFEDVEDQPNVRRCTECGEEYEL
jgi:hypothetical protein